MTPLDAMTGGRIDRNRQWAARGAICRHVRGEDLGPRWRRGSNSWRPAPFWDWRRQDPPCPDCGGNGDAMKASGGWNFCACGYAFVIGDYDWMELRDVRRFLVDREQDLVEPLPIAGPREPRPDEQGPPTRLMHALKTGDFATFRRLRQEALDAWREQQGAGLALHRPFPLPHNPTTLERLLHLNGRFACGELDVADYQAQARVLGDEMTAAFYARCGSASAAATSKSDRSMAELLERLGTTLAAAEADVGVQPGETIEEARRRNFSEAAAAARRRDVAAGRRP